MIHLIQYFQNVIISLTVTLVTNTLFFGGEDGLFKMRHPFAYSLSVTQSKSHMASGSFIGKCS